MPKSTSLFAALVRDPSPEPLSHLSILIDAACCYGASRGRDCGGLQSGAEICLAANARNADLASAILAAAAGLVSRRQRPECQLRMKASRSALMVSACVIGMPCGKPLYGLQRAVLQQLCR